MLLNQFFLFFPSILPIHSQETKSFNCTATPLLEIKSNKLFIFVNFLYLPQCSLSSFVASWTLAEIILQSLAWELVVNSHPKVCLLIWCSGWFVDLHCYFRNRKIRDIKIIPFPALFAFSNDALVPIQSKAICVIPNNSLYRLIIWKNCDRVELIHSFRPIAWELMFPDILTFIHSPTSEAWIFDDGILPFRKCHDKTFSWTFHSIISLRWLKYWSWRTGDWTSMVKSFV